MQGAAATYRGSSGVDFPLHTNQDVMALLAKLLSDQYGFFASISKEWRDAWGDLPKRTRAITADTSVSQLQESFDGGLKKQPIVCDHIVEHCDVAILQFAHSNGCRLSEKAFSKAAARGKLEIF